MGLLDCDHSAIQTKFIVDAQSVPSADLFHYLSRTRLFIDVWHSVSLHHIGTAYIPLVVCHQSFPSSSLPRICSVVVVRVSPASFSALSSSHPTPHLRQSPPFYTFASHQSVISLPINSVSVLICLFDPTMISIGRKKDNKLD